MRALLAFLAAVGMAAPVSAAWHEAKTKHFIIYADQRPAELAAFAAKLERFDAAVRSVRGMDDPPVGDGNRLTVFVLSDEQAVQQLAGDRSAMLYGFYRGDASGPAAFVPRRTEVGSTNDLRADTVFFHEYAHHLMFQAQDRPYPRWVVEGFAEFFSTARFDADGTVRVGAPATHRSYGLFDRENRLDMRLVLGDEFTSLNSLQWNWFYARSWLMVHHLNFVATRRGQLEAYVDGIAKGATPLDSAKGAFGDLQRFDIELDRYARQSQFGGLAVKPRNAQSAAVQVAPLSPGASQMILFRAQSRSGVDKKTVAAVAEQVRRVQQRFPGDELVEVGLAEAELDAGNARAAEAAADRAIRANPRNTDALVLKGRAIIAAARANKVTDARIFDEARRIFISANKIDTEDPEPLMEYYESYAHQRIAPTANAVAALHYAASLAPQDKGLRLTSALHYMDAGKAEDAKRALAALAFDPHGQSYSRMARGMIAKIDAGDLKGALDLARSPPSEDAQGSAKQR